MLELYQTMTGSRGSLAEVWIDRTARYVKKLYKPNGITIKGKPPLHPGMDEITRLYENELYWSEVLRGDMVLGIYEHGTLPDSPGYYIIQEYVGPDLLHHFNGKCLDSSIWEPAKQIIDMFTFFRQKDVYKLNNAMCNLVSDGGRIRAFDFKYAVRRSPETRPYEMESITKWISKIDSSLVDSLSELI